jgi:hypothetical protein
MRRAFIAVSMGLMAGLRSRRGAGTGPFLQLHVPEAHAKIWGVWAPLDPEHFLEPNPRSALLGVTIEL